MGLGRNEIAINSHNSMIRRPNREWYNQSFMSKENEANKQQIEQETFEIGQRLSSRNSIFSKYLFIYSANVFFYKMVC